MRQNGKSSTKSPSQMKAEGGASAAPAVTPSLSLSSLATIGAGALTIGGVVLYLMGHIAHSAYIEYWGLDVGLFPISHNDTLILGFTTLVDRWAYFLKLTAQQGATWLALFVGMVVYVYLLLQVPKTSKKPNRLANWIGRRPSWLRNLGTSFLACVILFTAVPFALVFLLLVLVIPAAAADNFGRDAAKRDHERYSAKCDIRNAENGELCVALVNDGKRIALGRVIHSSVSHLAFFDQATSEARSLARERIEVRVCPRSGCASEQTNADLSDAKDPKPPS